MSIFWPCAFLMLTPTPFAHTMTLASLLDDWNPSAIAGGVTLLIVAGVMAIGIYGRNRTTRQVRTARDLVRAGRYDAALAEYDKMRAQPTMKTPGLLGICNMLTVLGRYDEALSACDQALALAPTLVPAWRLKGNVLTSQLRYSEAIPIYQHALTLTTTDPQL